MKTINKYVCAALWMTFLLCFGCKEEGRLDHIDESAPAPAPVTIKEVINREGGAIIKYDIPNDKNLLGVKAVYERNGEICEAKASVYMDSLIVEGYAETKDHNVQLYSIGRNSKLSEPVDVKVTPLEAPIHSTKLNLGATFGGINIFFDSNRTNATLSIVVLIDSVGNGRWEPLQIFYTQAVSGRYARRGLEAKNQSFAVFIRDRWGNTSDTIIQKLLPMAEVKIPKDKFTNARLPGDSYETYGDSQNYRLEGIWEGTESTSDPDWGNGNKIYAGAMSAPIPQHFTISLGRKVALSRFKIWARYFEVYSGPMPRTFQIWGSTNPPADGSWDNWHLLGEWEVFKPSGYNADGTVGTVTAEDRDYLYSGGDYELVETEETPDPYQAISYLRFKTLSTFNTHGTSAKNGQLLISEVSFWGSLIDE